LSQKLHRRTILKSIVAVAATTAFGCSDEVTTAQQAAASRKFFPQSVASGDPRPDSVVLWTRAVDDAHGHAPGDTVVTLEVSKEEGFGALVLKLDGLRALATHDNALKVKVTNLEPRTTYYYRFIFEHDGERYISPVGRTKTAPAAGDDVPVKFVFASCQDYVGRYFNSWSRLLQLDEEVDFIVFLGDYIYETTGDPAFQNANTLRDVTFSDPAGAITQKNGIFQYLAASSLSNYRDVYKNLRADPVFQQVHERYPFIVMWDDHEFSDDCWQSNATYEDGRRLEKQDERKVNAEQAFFEYIPLDVTGTAGEGAIDVDSEPKFPNSKIYRDFEFGKNLKLIVTDYRTYRPDHLIPEDAYPGKVEMDKNVLAGTIAGLPLPQAVKDQISASFASDLFAYVNVDEAAYAQQKGVLKQAYLAQAAQAGLTPAEATAKADAFITGNLALAYVNQVLAAAGASALAIPTGGKDRGMAFLHMGKQGLFDIRGSRYIVIKDTYDLYAAYRYAATQKASENALGNAQETWFLDKVKATNTWKIIVSSVSMTALIWDLRQKTDIPDVNLRQRFYFNADQWDGFPTKKQELLGALRANNVSNALFISGDIHASYASVESGIPALTAPAISSGSVKELAGNAVVAAGYAQGSPLYGYVVAQMDKTLKDSNPGLVYSNSDAHGFVVLEVKSNEALATYHLIPSTEVSKDYSLKPAEELAAKATTQRLRVQNGAITAI
jgi:alkaline phosphatase D